MSVFKEVAQQDLNNDGEIGVVINLCIQNSKNNGQVTLSNLLVEDILYDHESDSDPSNVIADLHLQLLIHTQLL